MKITKDLFLFLILISISLLKLCLGEINLSLSELILLLQQEATSGISQIVFEIRLPRMLAVILTGSCLGISGLYFQSVLKNPLAEPFTMGFSGAAALGITSAISLGFTDAFWGPSLVGLIACLFVVFLTLKTRKLFSLQGHLSLILMGLAIGFFCSSIVILVQSLLNPNELFQSFQWLVGSFDSFRNSYWPLLLIPLGFSYVFHKMHASHLDKLLLGSVTAKSLNVPLQKIERNTLFLGALVCGFSVYVSGIIAFVGLAAPHMTKQYYKVNLHNQLYWRVILMGAIVLSAADLLSVILSNNQSIPTGGIVSLIGAPFLILLLMRKR